jgi:hypothetical protein
MAKINADLAKFFADIEAFKKQNLETLALATKKIVFEIHGRVSDKTPVDTGRARGNWFPSIGRPSTAYDPDAKDKVNPGGFVPQTFPPYIKAWITNNVPYIEALNNGHSAQAPANFVELAVAEVVDSFK